MYPVLYFYKENILIQMYKSFSREYVYISEVETLVCRVHSTYVYKITPACLPNGFVSFHSHHQCIRFLFVRAHFSTTWNYQTLFASFMGFSIYIPLIINEVKHIFMFISHMITFLKKKFVFMSFIHF